MSTGTIFKAMGRETGPVDHRKPRGKGEPCDKCGMVVYVSDWPFCRPSHPEDHLR